MKTLLVLTDFSDAATCAALYAAMLAKQLNSDTIILYHSRQVSIPVSEAAFVAIDEEASQYTARQELANLELRLKDNIPGGVSIRQRTDATNLNDINTVAKEENADLIIMGAVGKTKLEAVLLGSNAIAVCQSSNYPVILVPVQMKAAPVQKIIFACDMKDIEKTIPVVSLKKVVNSFKVPLTVLNVDFEDKHFTAETPLNTTALHDILKDYNPEYFNISSKDIGNGILEFTKLHPGSIVLLISRRHNFLEGIFYQSLTRRLAHITTFPLLILHEMEQ